MRGSGFAVVRPTMKPTLRKRTSASAPSQTMGRRATEQRVMNHPCLAVCRVAMCGSPIDAVPPDDEVVGLGSSG